MDTTKLRELISNNLLKSEKVNEFDTVEEKEAFTLAHTFIDIKESFEVYNELFQRISSENITKDEVDEILSDIGDELRHILYHIKDPKYYKYLSEE